MSVEVVTALFHTKMTSRINYNQPLKSVRTVRAAKIEQYDPQKEFGDDPARTSDADLMHDAGVAFSWEKEPGRSKVEQEKIDSISPVELKPPPQVLAPSSASKLPSAEVTKSLPQQGTESNGRSFHHLPNNRKLSSIEAVAVALPTDTQAAQTARSQPPTANHQLPPKPSQGKPPLAVPLQPSGDKPPQPRRNTSASVSQPSHHTVSGPLLSRNGDLPSTQGTAKKGSGQEGPVAKDGSRRHHSSLASTLRTLTEDEDSIRTDPKGAGSFVPSSDEGVPLSLSRGNHDYISARLRQSQSPAVVKDFYQSERHLAPTTVSNTGNLTRGTNSCMPTRPNSASASEAGSHSDDGDRTEIGDSFSQMNARDPDVRCQVSMIDGDQHELSSRHTDPRARDFIMERFLPAAKAMVTETSDGTDRRSSHETPLVSPTRKNGRSSALGRSRFAFKDRFAEEEEHEEADQRELLFKCKFPWQMGALRSSVPPPSQHIESESVEQSPSASFANNKYSPSPTASFENRKESLPRPVSDGQHEDAAWIYAESDGSATPRGEILCSFEERGLPPRSRTRSSPSVLSHRSQQQSRESDFYRDSNRNLSVIGEPAIGDYESEHSARSNESSFRASPGVPKDRLKETATQDDNRGGQSGNLGRRSPEMVYSGSLASLLRATQQQSRDLGRISQAAVQAVVAKVEQEPIPPSSILNHHRNNPARIAAAAAMSSAHGGNNSSTKSSQPGNAVVLDEGYPKHLKVNLIRQHVAEPSGGSGRSLESLNDEVWESARESPGASESYDRSGKVLTSSNSNSESANEGMHSSGWPLVRVQQLYTRTPSSDSKDASFSSVSERSLRSPTDLAVAVQQPSAEKYSPVSVLQPPLPKSPSESWLFKVKPLVPPSTGTNWQGQKTKKFLDYSSPDDSMDVKWEVLVKSENAKLRSKTTQEVQRQAAGLEKSDILGSKAR